VGQSAIPQFPNRDHFLMTLSSETVKVTYDGDDATTAFATTFVYWDDTDVAVILRSSAGVETTLTKGTHYTLAGGSGAVGTVTTTSGNTVATGETLTIKGDRADTQATTFATGGAFPSANAERAIDQIVRMVQQQSEEIGRKVGFSETSTDSDVDLPDLVADELWVVNSAGTGLESKALSEISSSALTTPVGLSDGGAAVDLTGLTVEDIIRLNTAGTALEGRSVSETNADLFAKGSDIASADPLVIGTDGGYFDVTGTTTFDEQTVAAGRLYMLQFDGALTMTDDADHDLGGADITTAAGDKGLFYAIAANTVQLISWIPEGSLPDKTVRDWELLGTASASASSSVDFETSINSTYHAYKILIAGLVPASDAVDLFLRIGTGGTPTYQSGASDYGWAITTTETGNVGSGLSDDADSEVAIATGVGTGANEDLCGEITIYDPSNTGFNTMVTYNISQRTSAALTRTTVGAGQYLADTAVTAIRLIMSSGNIASGEFRLYGLRDA